MIYTIGTLTLIAEPGSPGNEALYRGSTPVDLSPKAVTLLCLLADHAGELVSRDQIRDTIWPSQYVEETNLTRHVSLIRVCLREHLGEGEHVIRIPKKGYQLTVPVTKEIRESRPAPLLSHISSADVPIAIPAEPAPLPDAGTVSASSRFPRTLVLASATTGAVIAALVVLMFLPRSGSLSPAAAEQPAAAPIPDAVAPQTATAKSVAVLPPVLTGGTPQQETRFSGAIRMVETASAENGGIATVSSEQIADAVREFDLPKPIDANLASALGRRFPSDLMLATSGTHHGSASQLTLSLLDMRSGKQVASRAVTFTNAELLQKLPQSVAELLTAAGVSVDAPSTTAEGVPSDMVALENTAAAEALYQSGDYKQSLALLLPELKRSPASSHVHLLLANVYDAMGDDDQSATEARFALNTSRGLKGWRRIAVQARAEALLISWPSAIGSYSRLHKAFPRNVDYALALADAYESSEMHNTATATLRSVAFLRDPRTDAQFSAISAAKYAWKDDLQHAREELQHAQASGALTSVSDANARICKAQARLGNYDEALPACEAALKTARALHDDRAILFALNMQSDAMRLSGDTTLAAVTSERLALAEKTGNQSEVFESLIQKGFAAAGQKDFSAAGENFRKADAMAVQRNNLTMEAESKGMLSYLANITHDDDAMYTYAMQDLNIARSIQNKRWEANALGYIGSACSNKGDDDKARDYWQQAVVAAQASGDNHALYAMLHHLVSLETRQGHPQAVAKWKAQMDALPEDPVKQRAPHQANPSTPKPTVQVAQTTGISR